MPDLETMAKQETETQALVVPETPEQRARAAVALRVSGAPYSAIAQTLGFADAVAARNVVERTLADTVTSGDLKTQRALASERIERLLRSVWARATSDTITVGGKELPNADHLNYVRTALMLIDRHSRLHGLDAPTQVTINKPTDQEVVDWVHRVASEVGIMGVREAEDIMEAEVVQLDQEQG